MARNKISTTAQAFKMTLKSRDLKDVYRFIDANMDNLKTYTTRSSYRHPSKKPSEKPLNLIESAFLMAVKNHDSELIKLILQNSLLGRGVNDKVNARHRHIISFAYYLLLTQAASKLSQQRNHSKGDETETEEAKANREYFAKIELVVDQLTPHSPNLNPAHPNGIHQYEIIVLADNTQISLNTFAGLVNKYNKAAKHKNPNYFKIISWKLRQLSNLRIFPIYMTEHLPHTLQTNKWLKKNQYSLFKKELNDKPPIDRPLPTTGENLAADLAWIDKAQTNYDIDIPIGDDLVPPPAPPKRSRRTVDTPQFSGVEEYKSPPSPLDQTGLNADSGAGSGFGGLTQAPPTPKTPHAGIPSPAATPVLADEQPLDEQSSTDEHKPPQASNLAEATLLPSDPEEIKAQATQPAPTIITTLAKPPIQSAELDDTTSDAQAVSSPSTPRESNPTTNLANTLPAPASPDAPETKADAPVAKPEPTQQAPKTPGLKGTAKRRAWQAPKTPWWKRTWAWLGKRLRSKKSKTRAHALKAYAANRKIRNPVEKAAPRSRNQKQDLGIFNPYKAEEREIQIKVASHRSPDWLQFAHQQLLDGNAVPLSYAQLKQLHPEKLSHKYDPHQLVHVVPGQKDHTGKALGPIVIKSAVRTAEELYRRTYQTLREVHAYNCRRAENGEPIAKQLHFADPKERQFLSRLETVQLLTQACLDFEADLSADDKKYLAPQPVFNLAPKPSPVTGVQVLKNVLKKHAVGFAVMGVAALGLIAAENSALLKNLPVSAAFETGALVLASVFLVGIAAFISYQCRKLYQREQQAWQQSGPAAPKEHQALISALFKQTHQGQGKARYYQMKKNSPPLSDTVVQAKSKARTGLASDNAISAIQTKRPKKPAGPANVAPLRPPKKQEITRLAQTSTTQTIKKNNTAHIKSAKNTHP